MNKLKDLRKEKELTQQQVCDILIKFAMFFDTTTDKIFGDEKNKGLHGK